MKFVETILAGSMGVVTALSGAGHAQTRHQPVKNIVLVHGAFADMERMAKLMPNASYAYCSNGSHLCMWDDQRQYFDHLLGFLKSL